MKSTHRLSKLVSGLSAIALVVAMAGVLAPSASAQFPGANGVIYFDAGGNIFFASEGASSSTQVTTTGGFDHPDSCPTNPNQVIFEGGTGIFFVPDVTAPVVNGPIPNTVAGHDNPVFNNDCSRFAVETSTGISVFSFPGGAPSPGALSQTASGTGSINGPGRNPEWSPDGQRIYFEADVDPGAADQRTIFFVNSNTGAGQTTAVQSGAGGCGVGGFDCRDVRVFPNGNQLAMELFGAPTGLGVAPLNGPVTPHAASPGAADDELDVSPDGTKIVVENGGTLRVYSSDASSASATTFSPQAGLSDPDWALSPTAPTPPATGTISGTATSSSGGGFGGFLGIGTRQFPGFGSFFGGGGGGGVSGVEVTAENETTGDEFTDTTDSDGDYSLDVPPGDYEVTATLNTMSTSQFGFGGGSSGPVSCTSGGDTTVDVTVSSGDTEDVDWSCPSGGGFSFGGFGGFGGFLGGLFGGGGGFGGLFG